MKFFFLIALCNVVLLPVHAELDDSKPYLNAYLWIQEAQQLENVQKDYLGAMIRYKWAGISLQHFREVDPNWQADLLISRIKLCQDSVKALEPKATAQILAQFHPDSSFDVAIPYFDAAQEAQRANDHYGTLVAFDECRTALTNIHRAYPKWHPEETSERIALCEQKIGSNKFAQQWQLHKSAQ
jgi:hypothetical protein